jgi:hypothetical protein
MLDVATVQHVIPSHYALDDEDGTRQHSQRKSKKDSDGGGVHGGSFLQIPRARLDDLAPERKVARPTLTRRNLLDLLIEREDEVADLLIECRRYETVVELVAPEPSHRFYFPFAFSPSSTERFIRQP